MTLKCPLLHVSKLKNGHNLSKQSIPGSEVKSLSGICVTEIGNKTCIVSGGFSRVIVDSSSETMSLEDSDSDSAWNSEVDNKSPPSFPSDLGESTPCKRFSNLTLIILLYICESK